MTTALGCSQCGRDYAGSAIEFGFSSCIRHIGRQAMGTMYGPGDSQTWHAPTGHSGDPRTDTTAQEMQRDRAEQILDNPPELAALFGFDKLSPDMHGLGDMDALGTAFLILQHYRAGRHDMAAEMDEEWRQFLKVEIVERGLA